MSTTTTCRSCGDQTENYSGFCNKGICTIMEEGYHLGFREGMHGRDFSAKVINGLDRQKVSSGL